MKEEKIYRVVKIAETNNSTKIKIVHTGYKLYSGNKLVAVRYLTNYGPSIKCKIFLFNNKLGTE